jgi:hypothetical protein
MPSRSPVDRNGETDAQRLLAVATISALIVASAAAFAITERLKLTPSPIVGTRVTKTFSPVLWVRYRQRVSRLPPPPRRLGRGGRHRARWDARAAACTVTAPLGGTRTSRSFGHTLTGPYASESFMRWIGKRIAYSFRKTLEPRCASVAVYDAFHSVGWG